jgi:hypothetical protein
LRKHGSRATAQKRTVPAISAGTAAGFNRRKRANAVPGKAEAYRASIIVYFIVCGDFSGLFKHSKMSDAEIFAFGISCL